MDAGTYAKRGQAFEEEGLYDRAIEEYTQAILLDPEMAEAYFGRAWAHETKGGHGLAIRNFTKAIDLKPDCVEAFYGRGWVYEKQGDTERAIEEYSKAIRVEPGYADAHFSRGILEFNRGRLEEAAKDFTTVYKAANGSLRDYALLWSYVSKARTGTGLGKALKIFAGADNRETLPGVLISMFQGKAAPAEVIAATQNASSKKQLEREAVAYFFLGQHQLVLGDAQGAAEYFNKTLATGVTYFRQYTAAKIELERLRKSNR